MTESHHPRPVCFIAMPFRSRKTNSTKDNAPAEVDFDALWHKAYQPAILKAGFTAIRADFDAGTVIVKDMVERLAYADLVLADVSVPNGNVYYELGLRHAARETGCISFAADWSNQLFDIEQFRSIRYPLEDGNVPEDQAEYIKSIVVGAIEKFKASRTPWFEYIDRTPNKGWSEDTRGIFRQDAEKLSEFQADIQTIRYEAGLETRKQRVRDELTKLEDSPALALTQVAVEMVMLIRDELDNGKSVIDFISSLDKSIQALPFMEEQRLLALGKSGENAQAVAHLKTLVEKHGATPERLGLIGGRYKRLWREARSARKNAGQERPSSEERQFLQAAIEAYDQGMLLDLNGYFCACNLPLLLMERGKKGDLSQAQVIDCIVIAACERAIKRNEDDEWTRPTLLGAAFRSDQLDLSEEYVEEIETSGARGWKIKSTLSDLREIVEAKPEGHIREAQSNLLRRLEDL